MFDWIDRSLLAERRLFGIIFIFLLGGILAFLLRFLGFDPHKEYDLFAFLKKKKIQDSDTDPIG